MPVWSFGAVIYCQECVCSYGTRQNEWCPHNPSKWTQEGGLPAFAYSCLRQICKACFTCQSLGLFELFFLLFSPDSFLSKQSRKKQKLKTVLLKKADCVCSAGVPFLGQMLGRIVKMIEARQLSLLLHVCLLQISCFITWKKQFLTHYLWIQELHKASEMVCLFNMPFLRKWSITF